MRFSTLFVAELEALRLRHLEMGSLDVAQEILDLLREDSQGGREDSYEDGYNAAIGDAKTALDDLYR